MKQFNSERHRTNPWQGAPTWAFELAEMQFITMLQNEAILAWLENRPCKNSPEDQAKINSIFDAATGITKKIEDAEKA